MKILVTGSDGFVGRNLIPFLRSFDGFEVIGLDMDNLRPGIDEINTFDTSKINDFTFLYNEGEKTVTYRLGTFGRDLKKFCKEQGFNRIIHLAAQSHVDRSIMGPRQFVDDNVRGTLELFEVAREIKELEQILLFGTDEVVACLSEGKAYERSVFNCGSVYSATKAAQECLAQAYIKTFSLPVVTTRCVNIFGPYQHDEKFIPTVIRKALQDESIPIYGDGYQSREWVHIDHVCKFTRDVSIATFFPPGEVLHITGTQEIPNIVMARLILGLLGKPQELIKSIADRPGHDVRYALGRNTTDDFGLQNYMEEKTFMNDLIKTVDWYKEKLNER